VCATSTSDGQRRLGDPEISGGGGVGGGWGRIRVLTGVRVQAVRCGWGDALLLLRRHRRLFRLGSHRRTRVRSDRDVDRNESAISRGRPQTGGGYDREGGGCISDIAGAVAVAALALTEGGSSLMAELARMLSEVGILGYLFCCGILRAVSD
jgi:hypothetical protein